MAFLQWSPAFSVGVERFDEQHRTLIGLINDLHSAMMAGRGKEALGAVLGALTTYTRTHFADEERMMLERGYPALSLHRQEHGKLMKQVEALQARVAAGNAQLTLEVLAFLKDWLVTHIQGHDRAYGELLGERGR